MNEKHIPFETLSDFCDNILSDVETIEVKNHLQICKICNEEFEKLSKTIVCLNNFKKIVIADKDIFIKHTIVASKRRHVYSIVKRAIIPVTAAAAVFLFVITSTIETQNNFPQVSDSFANNGKIDLPENVIYDELIDNRHSVPELVRYLKRHRIRISKVTNSYIEGEADYKDYYRVKYGISPSQNIMPMNKYNSGLQLVGSGSSMTYYQPSSTLAPKVKFRIIRK